VSATGVTAEKQDDGAGRPGSDRGAPAPLRQEIVDIALGRREGARLDAFLASRRPAEALALWYGEEVHFLLARGKGAALRAALDRDIAAIDALAARQLDAILHTPRFQALEASWRGVHYLVEELADDESILIRILSLSWRELCRDLERSTEFDQSSLFAKVYSEEFGMPGGKPYGLLIADYTVCHRPMPGRRTDDVGALRSLATVAAAAFAPVVVGAAPELLGIESFAELGHLLNVDAIFRGEDYRRWRSLEEMEEARFLGVALPRVLMREPYADRGDRRDGFRYREGKGGMRPTDYLWGNAAYAFAVVVGRAFGQSRWFGQIRGTLPEGTGAGLVPGLKPLPYDTDRCALTLRRPIEAEITDGQEKALSDRGFIALSPCRLSPKLAFLGNQSVQRRAQGGLSAPAVNGRLSAMLQYILCVSRFSHYIKVMVRDRVGDFTTADAMESFLQQWLHGHTLGNDDASIEQKAKYPLREASVRIRDIPGRPGVLSCVIHLQPHFQLDQVASSFRLHTEVMAAQ
jgi:type VI secretion system protein ImpD